jgi:4-nitrophenyl phosphatase
MNGFLIDLDGTLYRGSERIEYADDFVRWLKLKKYSYLYVTNNSSRTPEQVAAHLQGMGIAAQPGDVVTSGQAAAEYIVKQNRGRKVYMIGEHGLEQALREAGLELTEDDPDYVVQGIDRQLTYGKLEKAVRHILAGAESILTNPDHLIPNDGGLSPGAGSIAAAIRTASGREPVVIGKPFPHIMQYAIARIGLPVENIWVVGDNLRTDIAGGKAARCRTALVMTGVTTPDQLDAQIHQTGTVPDLVASHLMELADRIGD